MNKKVPAQLKLLIALGVLGVSMFVSYPHIRDWAANRDAESSPNQIKEALRAGEMAANNRRFEEAELAYQEALELIVEARVEDPEDPDLQKYEINVLDRLLGIAENRNDHAAASEWSTKALASAEKHFDSRPTHTHYRQRLLYTAAQAFKHSPRPYPGNVEVFKESLSKVERTDKDVRAIWLVRENMVEAWKRIAAAEADAENPEGMASAIREGIKWSQPTESTQEPRSKTLKLEASVIQEGRSKAEALNSEALENEFTLTLIDVRAQQARLEPHKIRYQTDLANLRLNMAKVFREDKTEEAEKLYQSAVEGLSKAYAAQPGNSELLKNYLRSLNLRGRFFSDQERDDEALNSYRDAYENAAHLPDALLTKRLFNMKNYAILLMRTQQTEEARGIAQEAFDLAKAASMEKPNSEIARIDAADAGLRLARYLKRRPNPQRKKALEIAQAQASILTLSPTSRPSQAKLEMDLKTLVKELKRR